MIKFLAKRLAMMLGVLLVVSVVMYGLLCVALDPIDELRLSTSPNKEQLIAARTRALHLDEPWFTRYLRWLGNMIHGDMGSLWHSGAAVSKQLLPAMSNSLQLILLATLLAIIVGVTIGVVSALRQYTGFDYVITIVSFILFSLPVFWLAVMLKEWGAIGLNDYLLHPTVNWLAIAVAAAVVGLACAGVAGGLVKRRAIAFAAGFVIAFAVLAYLFASGWLQNPRIGVVGCLLISVATAVAATATFAGLRNRRALYSALTQVAVGVLVTYLALPWLYYYVPASMLMMLGLFVAAVAVACLIGWLWGGPDRAVSMRVTAIVAVVMSVLAFVDRVMQEWQGYVTNGRIKGRPIATIGAETPGLTGDFWMMNLDRFTHLLLPSIALILISFAGYTRYERGAMLEVLNQEYIRTARAKGLTERIVVVRHALRNALLPLASLIPVDLVTLIGGAVMTESIFGWSGMGKFFRDTLSQQEIDGVMAYILIVGLLAMVANLIADFLYAVLDPRIKVNA